MNDMIVQTSVGRPPLPPMPISFEEPELESPAPELAPLLRAVTPPAEEQVFVPRVPQTREQIGPAVNSGKSFLIYGQPGNGKTYLAETLFKLDSTSIYVPYAIEHQGSIIKLFDPVYHQRIEEAAEVSSSISADAQHDGRWVR